jgi:hypothetical protein
VPGKLIERHLVLGDFEVSIANEAQDSVICGRVAGGERLRACKLELLVGGPECSLFVAIEERMVHDNAICKSGRTVCLGCARLVVR